MDQIAANDGVLELQIAREVAGNDADLIELLRKLVSERHVRIECGGSTLSTSWELRTWLAEHPSTELLAGNLYLTERGWTAWEWLQ